MTMRAIAIAFVAFFGLGCGEVMSNEVAPAIDAGDASIADSAADADSGMFVCGTRYCRETELCVYPARGCVVSIEPLTDAGTCPDGTSFADVFNGCIANTGGAPPYCWSPTPDNNALQCSGADGSLSGFVDHVPSGSGHVCYATCA